jgi:hypothetical protein
MRCFILHVIGYLVNPVHLYRKNLKKKLPTTTIELEMMVGILKISMNR